MGGCANISPFFGLPSKKYPLLSPHILRVRSANGIFHLRIMFQVISDVIIFSRCEIIVGITYRKFKMFLLARAHKQNICFASIMSFNEESIIIFNGRYQTDKWLKLPRQAGFTFM